MSSNFVRDDYYRTIVRLRSSRGKFLIHEDIVRTFGGNEAIFLAYLFDKLEWYLDEGKDQNGWFYCTVAQIETKLGLSHHQQWRITKKLKKLEVLSTQERGIPKKRYFFLHAAVLENVVKSSEEERRRKQVNKVTKCTTVHHCVPATTDDCVSATTTKDNQTELIKHSRRKPADSLRSPEALPPTRVVVEMTHNSREPFFATSEQNNTPTLPEHKEFSTMLRNALRSQGVPCGNKNPIRTWSDEFRKLNSVVDTATIKEVLIWYIQNMKKERMYQAYSGKAFRLKFDKIWAWMKRDKEQTPTTELPPQAQKTLSEIMKWKWPKDSQKFVPAAFSVSYTNWKKCCTVIGKATDTFTSGVMRSYMIDGGEFLLNWFRRIHKELTDWKDWSGTEGSFRRYVFTPGSERFVGEVIQRSMSYSGKRSLGAKFLEEVRK